MDKLDISLITENNLSIADSSVEPKNVEGGGGHRAFFYIAYKMNVSVVFIFMAPLPFHSNVYLLCE